MRYRLAILTHGSSDPLAETLASFEEHVFPRPSSVRVYADGAGGPSRVLDAFRKVYGYGEIDDDVSAGEKHGIAPFRSAPFPISISHPSDQVGFCAATGNLWRDAADGDEDFVFWLEHDFVFVRDVDLRELAYVLEENPRLAQIALVRGPVNEAEIAAGGLVEARPGEFSSEGTWFDRFAGDPADLATAHDLYERPWLAHRSFFSTNPSLMRREFMVKNPWPPYTSECEGRFGIDLVKRGFSFAMWGSGEPWVDHIGVRDGIGY